MRANSAEEERARRRLEAVLQMMGDVEATADVRRARACMAKWIGI